MSSPDDEPREVVPTIGARQSARAWEQGDPLAALSRMRLAERLGLDSLDPHRREAVEAASRELAQLERAARLAQVVRFDAGHAPTSPTLLVGFAAALPADFDFTREALAALADDPPAPLVHPLALAFLRAAEQYERQERDAEAAACWKRSWRCWLRCADVPLFEHLLSRHRARLDVLLARGDIARARPLWDMLTALPLGDRLVRFRDDFATDFLLDTRDTMRHGAIPEGWREDYEQGLLRLRRYLSLDRDNVPLLVAAVETCADWLSDLYEAGDEVRLRLEAERGAPLASQLARLAPGLLAARRALADFLKFRAFAADDPRRKRELYQAAQEMDPANDERGRDESL